MTSILLIIIYLAFISLGLPDSILGSAWPSMYGELNVPVSYAGIVTMVIAGGTIVSSLMSERLIKKLDTGAVTAASVALTAVALFGFSLSHSFVLLCLWGIPYGLGAGSVDAALNNFVALHYKSKHMNWLHCFWGIGATAGPYIMGLCLTNNLGWNRGYRTIGVIQAALTVCLIFSLPLWKTKQSENSEDVSEIKSLGIGEAIRLPGAKYVMTAFFGYCSLEATAGLWASSYMVLCKGIDADTAAKLAALFYIGITAGRFVSGFVTERLGSKNMIRIGQGLSFLGAAILLFSLNNILIFAGMVLIGLGCAPIFPTLLDETPDNFGKECSQAIMGMQMASAYVGTTFMPLIFGFLSGKLGIGAYPVFLAALIILMLVMTEKVNAVCRGKPLARFY